MSALKADGTKRERRVCLSLTEAEFLSIRTWAEAQHLDTAVAARKIVLDFVEASMRDVEGKGSVG